MNYYQEGDSIECQCSEIISKKFNKGYLKTHPRNGNTYLFYKCERSGTAEIKQELNPKKAVIDESSYLNKGDKLNGDRLDIYINKKRRLKPEHIGGYTGRHGSRKINTDKFTYAQITKRYNTIPLKSNYKNE
jgi:hypothetical protein